MAMDESVSISNILDEERLTNEQHQDFMLRKNWIDAITDELDENLKLFFRVMVGVRNLPENAEREKLWLQLSSSVTLDLDDMIDRLKRFHSFLQLSHYKILHRYQHILNGVETLRDIQPKFNRPLKPKKDKKSTAQSLQWITSILASKAKIRHLTKKNIAMQTEIDDTKQELYMLKDRSKREIEEITEKSELKLLAIKQYEDDRFLELQEGISKTVTNLDETEEYRNFLNDQDQKRRKLTKLNVQLQQWIKQYDKFVGDPTKELKVLEAECVQFLEWKKSVYHPQKDKLEHLRMRVDSRKYEQLMARVEQFRIEHAARVIQRAWRKILESRKRRKKGKKGKKHKKGTSRKKKQLQKY